MAIFTGLLAAGTALAGDYMSQSGTQDTNATNAAINNQNINAAYQRQATSQEFNADQAQISRNWSAAQIADQEGFQNNQVAQAEGYNTTMSDTAMQRRVADLKAAGINPLLAVSQGGASTPTISPMPGSITSAAQASGGPAGAPGPIAMQNPNAAFGNLGGQMSNAMQTANIGAQIDLLKAQTNKLNTESGTEIPANVGYLKSMTGLTDQNATQSYYNTMRIQEQIYGERLSNDQLRDVTIPMQNQNLQVLQGTRDALISAQQSEATAKQLGLSKLSNLNDIQQSNLGQVLNWLNAILQPVGTAAGAARDLR